VIGRQPDRGRHPCRQDRIRRTVTQVTHIDPWPTATLLTGRRLVLEPLQPDHADEMAVVLDDPALHEYAGGAPATAEELRRRYATLTGGRSPDGSECWLNWVVRHRADSLAVGFVQATVTRAADQFSADVAWVIGTAQQHQGFAQEAAALMVSWLRRQGAASIVAHIHPEHRASAAVAQRIGLTPTGDLFDGEVRWVGHFESD
jgi:RimJ/RimL family protein N-acetyltransferase